MNRTWEAWRPGEAAVGAPWSPCPWHRCVRRVPPPALPVSRTRPPSSSHSSARDALRARLLAVYVGWTGLWRPEPATPHPAWPSRGAVSSARTRCGGAGFLQHKNQPPWSRQVSITGWETWIHYKPRATSGCLSPLLPRTWHKWTPETRYCNRVNDLRVNSSSYKTETSLEIKVLFQKYTFYKTERNSET